MTKLTRDDDCSEADEINPYQNVVLNKVYRDDFKMVQMEHWSILSGVVTYVQHDQDSKTLYDLNIKALDYRNHKRYMTN